MGLCERIKKPWKKIAELADSSLDDCIIYHKESDTENMTLQEVMETEV